MEGFWKFGSNSRKLSKKIIGEEKREDGTGESNEKITTRTKIFKETRYVTWEIENFKFTPLKFGEYHESSPFSTGFQYSTKWTLRVYPRGKNSIGEKIRSIVPFVETIGFYLHKDESPNVKINVKFDIKVGNLEDEEKDMISIFVSKKENILMTAKEEECGLDVDWCGFNGERIFRLLDECFLSFTLTGESLKVFCVLNVGYLEDDDESSSPGGSGSTKDETLSNDFKEILLNGKFSDLRFQVGKKKIPAHKQILAARSQYFATLFQPPMKESQTNVVNVEDVELPVFNDFLHYIYTSKVEDLTIGKAIALYSVADKYLLDELRKLCTRVILANLNVDNVCEIAVLGYQHSDRELKAAVNHVFRKFKHMIFDRKEWKRLIDEKQQLVSEILRDVSSDFHSKC